MISAWALLFAFVLAKACHDDPPAPVIPCDRLQDGGVLQTERLTVNISRCLNDTMLLYYDVYPMVNETLYFTNNVTFFLSLFRMDYVLTKSEGPLLPDRVDVEAGTAGTIDARIFFAGIGTLYATHEIVNKSERSFRDVSHPEALAVRLEWRGINGSLVLGGMVVGEVPYPWCRGPGVDPAFWIDVRQNQHWTEGPIEVHYRDRRGLGEYLFPMSTLGGNLTFQPLMDCECWGWTCDDRRIRICDKTDAQSYRDDPPKEWPLPCNDDGGGYDGYDGSGSGDDGGPILIFLVVWGSLVSLLIAGAVGRIAYVGWRNRESMRQIDDVELN